MKADQIINKTTLLAKGYELIDGITVPVGTSNVDLGVEGKEPQNAEKLTIAVGNEKINMYVFRPANYKAGEKTPLVYFIHGGGLAARLALYNKDKGKVPLKGQVLIYPMLDYRTGGEKDIYKNEYAGHCVWTKENNVFGWGKLMEGQAKALTDEEMIYFSPAMATVEQLKGLPETFMIVGSLDLFCDEDMTYAQKLMEAGIFTELYVEPGVPHAYEYLEWTPQAHRFIELRNHATARMLGAEKDVEESAEAKAFRELLLKYNMEQ